MDPRQADPEQYDRDDDPAFFDEPADEPQAVSEYGTTPQEQAEGEPLDVRLAREQPDGPPTGDPSATRLQQPSDPEQDETKDEVASEVRSDRLSAEEQAVHPI